VIAPWLEGLWREAHASLLEQDAQMRAKKGRAPDYGEPAAIVQALDAVVGRRVAVASDLGGARVTLDVTDDAAILTATLEPGSADGPARAWVDGMRVGDAAPVLALPSTSALAIGSRASEAEREAEAKDLEAAVTSALGARLKEPARVHDVIESATRARDESFALALSVGEPSGAFLSGPVRDAAAAERAIRGAVELTKAEPLKDLLRVRDVRSTSEELAGLGKIDVLTVVREPPSRRPRAEATPLVSAAWAIDPKALSLGVGPEAPVTLKLGARPDRRLADEPALKRFVASVGGDAATVAIAQPLRLDPRRADLPLAPLAIALGRRGGRAFVQLDVADALLREAARWQMGL
jgi:hypothetical protein